MNFWDSTLPSTSPVTALGRSRPAAVNSGCAILFTVRELELGFSYYWRRRRG